MSIDLRSFDRLSGDGPPRASGSVFWHVGSPLGVWGAKGLTSSLIISLFWSPSARPFVLRRDVGGKGAKGRGAHRIKKYFNSSELGVLSTTANSNLGSVDTGTVGAVREEQKQDFDQNQDSVPRYS